MVSVCYDEFLIPAINIHFNMHFEYAGVVTTIAGNGKQGFQDGPCDVSSFNNPRGIAVDSNGNIFIADTENNKIRKIRQGILSHIV